MAIQHLTEENFDAVTGEGRSLVDFWATWCGPCRMQAPILEQLDGELEGSVKICKVDIDEQPELARRFGIMSIPTLVTILQTTNLIVGLLQSFNGDSDTNLRELLTQIYNTFCEESVCRCTSGTVLL